MSKPKKKYYVVWAGKRPGIYLSWEECRRQVDGEAGAKYMSFPTLEAAEEAFEKSHSLYVGKKPLLPVNRKLSGLTGIPVWESISVDAACSGNPGVLEYRGVYTNTGKEIFRRGPFPEGTTNIGEFLAIVTGLAWLRVNKLDLPLYSDSRNGIKWVKMKRVNTKLEKTPENAALFEVIDKALVWLHNNSYENKILKWETAEWGEIPADFGRK
jgi:ribonuclease HI